MDQLAMNPQYLHGTFARLGVQVGDTYQINKDCLATLYDIRAKLSIEDRTLRTFRRAMGCADVVKKDLLPLLVGVRDDSKIVDVTVEILLNLTVPVECLLPMESMMKTDVGQITVMELTKQLSNSKEAFVSSQSTRPVVDHIKTILEKEPKLSYQDCESISNCLLLLRNILHIPEHRLGGSVVSMQNQILWNLFAQNVDKVLIQLMTSKYQAFWGVTMVQLLALMYKDQQVGTLQKLLNLWFESSLSDSSEGNESNTSPQHQASGDSSSVMTSDPTSDSSDNGGSNKKRSPYQTGDSKSVNNDSDDSQSSEPGLSASPLLSNMPSAINSSPMDTDQNHFQVRPATTSQVRVKGLPELQPRCWRLDKLSDVDGNLPKEQSHDSFGHGRHHDSFGKSQEMKLHKEPLSKLHLLHKTIHCGGNQTKVPVKKGESGSEVSDCGYGTQMENQESNSTSSNEDDAPQRCIKHQKPQHMLQKSRYSSGKLSITPQEKKELHRKKLVKRSHTNTMHMKALLHHAPSDDDISNLLKEFTVDFLLRGYANLVKVLHHHLLEGGQVQMDTSHFFWLVTYFLKFATQLELDLEHISSSVLTMEIVSYLTYKGVNLYEELQMSIQSSGEDLKPCLRRMHLVVTSIREFIQAVETYKKISHLTEDDRNHLLSLQLQIAKVQDLRGLFVLLLRHYNPTLQSQQYLQDLIVTNHNLLIFVENAFKLPEFCGQANLVEHIKQFGTVEVMRNYGLLLGNFLDNGDFVNDCVLTMMHHVAGDLSQVTALIQPSILRSLSGILESDYELCDDWSDLIEYVLHNFEGKPLHGKGNLLSKQISPTLEGNKTEWANDTHSLYWFYQQCKGCEDPVEAIKNKYESIGVHDKTRISIIQQLLQGDIINEQNYGSLMERETMKSSKLKSAAEEEASRAEEMDGDNVEPGHDIRVLKGKLESDGHSKMIVWLQKLLLEMCFAKISLERNLPGVKEPVCYIYTRLQQSIPLVPWYFEQEQCLNCPEFIVLLHKLGLHLAGDADKLFPRVPHFWATDDLFQAAEKLGPINESDLKFDPNVLKQGFFRIPPQLTLSVDPMAGICSDNISTTYSGPSSRFETSYFVPSASKTSSLNRFTPEPVMSNMPNWLQVVQHSKDHRCHQPNSFMEAMNHKEQDAQLDTFFDNEHNGNKQFTPISSGTKNCEVEELNKMDTST